VLTTEQSKQGSSLKLAHLRTAMNKYYRQVYKKNITEETDNELQLAATNGGSGKGSNANKKKKFTGNCNMCGKVGHKAADCWSNPKNADKRPGWYKGGEVTAAKTENEAQKCSKELQLTIADWTGCPNVLRSIIECSFAL
jgi:hypothetical protein